MPRAVRRGMVCGAACDCCVGTRGGVAPAAGDRRMHAVGRVVVATCDCAHFASRPVRVTTGDAAAFAICDVLRAAQHTGVGAGHGVVRPGLKVCRRTSVPNLVVGGLILGAVTGATVQEQQ